MAASSPHIRYAGAINEYGRTLAGAMRPGTRPILGPGQARDEFFILATLLGMRQGASRAAGPLEHAVLLHRKVAVAAFRRGRVTYYISVDRRAGDLGGIVDAAKRAA